MRGGEKEVDIIFGDSRVQSQPTHVIHNSFAGQLYQSCAHILDSYDGFSVMLR